VLYRLSAEIDDVRMWKWRPHWVTIGPWHPEESWRNTILCYYAQCRFLFRCVNWYLSLSLFMSLPACCTSLITLSLAEWQV